MPVIHVAALPQGEAVDLERVAGELAARAGAALGCPPGHVWVTWRTLDAYAEGDETTREARAGTHPPVAEILAYEGRDDAAVRRALEAVADALVELLGREPGSAFVHYTELKAGRVYTGGAVRG